MVVIFRFVGSPATIRTGKPAASASAASSVATRHPRPAVDGRRAARPLRNACGVCAR